MKRLLIFGMLFGLYFSTYGQEGLPVRFISKYTKHNDYYVYIADRDTIKPDVIFLPRSRGDSLVCPIMAEIKTLLDSTCPGRNDRLAFNIFVTYNRNREIRKIAYIIKMDDISCFNEEIYAEIYWAFVDISRTLPMVTLIDGYWSRVGDIKRETGNFALMFEYNGKKQNRYQ